MLLAHQAPSLPHITPRQDIRRREPTAQIGLEIDGKEVKIPVTPEIRVLWREHFVLGRRTQQHQTRAWTLMSLIRAAYRKGRADGVTIRASS